MSNRIPDSRLETLAYLRERARLAHLDGNGILVNHLVAIALEEMKKPQVPGTAALPMATWAWSVVFALFWLTDSYMLSEVEKALENAASSTDADKELVEVMRAYFWLVRQPLDTGCEQQKIELQKAALSWAKEPEASEFEVLLTHSIELLWFRDPRGTDWANTTKSWTSRVSSTLGKRLTTSLRRLAIQTSMAVLGAARSTDLTVDPEWDTLQWVPQLWQCVFDCDFRGIEKILSTESPKHSANTPIDRLLFDARHYNRFRGVWGDPQAIGLTRRRLITTLSPELVFEDIRKDRTSRLIADLYLGPGYATDRFFGSTLAMLLELAALRRWDIGSWREAVGFQARLNAEIATREPAKMGYVDRAIRCAVGAFKLDEKYYWIEPTLARLEFLPEAELTTFVGDLLNARPVHYHHVKRVIAKLGDAIPSALHGDVARWSVRYVHHSTTVDQFGSSIDKIEFLAPLLSVIPPDHEAWNILWPIIESLFSTPQLWQVGSNQLFRRVLTKAPLTMATKAVSTMLSTAGGEGDNRARWRLLCDTADERPELAAQIPAAILGAAPLPEDAVSLRDKGWAKTHIKIDEDAVRSRAHAHLAKVVEKAVMPEGKKQFETTGMRWEIVFYVRWTDEDIVWIERLLAAVDNPRVIRGHVGLLVTYLSSMAKNGPSVFAEHIAPYLLAWLKNPPFGIDPMGRHSGVFSTFRVNSDAKPEIVRGLAELATVVRRKLASDVDTELIRYVMRIAAPPPIGVTGAAMRLTLDLAIDHPDRRPELFSVCQAFLLAAHLRAASDIAASEELMDGFRAPTWFASSFRPDVVPREIVRELAEKIEPLVSAIGQSGAPRMRGQVAAFLAALKSRDALTPELTVTHEVLLKDPRASVRRFAAGN